MKKQTAEEKRKQGQDGPKIDSLSWERMNVDEREIVRVLIAKKTVELKELSELFPEPHYARNALRRLVRSGCALKVEAGVYRGGPGIPRAFDGSTTAASRSIGRSRGFLIPRFKALARAR